MLKGAQEVKDKYYIGFILALYFPACFSNGVERIRIVDKDKPHIGVKSNIKVMNADGKYKLVSKTDSKGYVSKEFNCIELEVATIHPENDTYFSEDLECPINTSLIMVTSFKYYTNLILNADSKIAAGDFGTAALALSDAAARLKDSDVKTANKIEVRAFEATGAYLNVYVSTSFDPTQNKVVMSNELKNAVLIHQGNAGLKTTGILDYPTLKTLSNKSLNAMLFSAPEN